MIEIKCALEEKIELMDCFVYSECTCIIPKSADECRAYKSCVDCLEENIKWIITDGGV